MRSTEARLPEDSLSNPDEVISRALHRLEAHGDEKHLKEEVIDTWTSATVRKHLSPDAHKLHAVGWEPKERCGKSSGSTPTAASTTYRRWRCTCWREVPVTLDAKAGQTEGGNTTG